ncbi:hypothetical protein [Methylobacterium sp. CM6257]|jgi:hypothetical protein
MPRYCFDALLAVSMTTALSSSPAFAQVIADPPVGSSEASETMSTATDAIPERVRTYDPDVTGGIKVRSDLADKPHKSAPRPKPH